MGHTRTVRKMDAQVTRSFNWIFVRLTPLQRRKLEGCLCRVPTSFYNQVWDVMTRTPQGIRVLGNVIPQHPTLSNMSRTELTFALFVEEVLTLLKYFRHYSSIFRC